MISTVSAYLTAILLKEQIISEDEKDSYKYGFEISIANLINGGIILLIGIGLHLLLEAVMFYAVFVSLRFFCGGYHANSYIKCFLSFALTGMVCLVISDRFVCLGIWVIGLFLVAAVCLGWCIWEMAPVEHENRSITSEERIFFRKRSIQVYCFWSGVGIALWMVHLTQITAIFISTFIAVSILMIGGKNNEKRNA